MWKFLKQSYLLSVFKMMSEDGDGGRSKVLWGFEESELILFCMYRKLLKIEGYRTQAMTSKMDIVEEEADLFLKGWVRMLSRVEAKCHEWLRTTNFFFVVYTGISWKMERWLMWKYFEAHLFIFSLYNDDWCKMERFVLFTFSFQNDEWRWWRR